MKVYVLAAAGVMLGAAAAGLQPTTPPPEPSATLAGPRPLGATDQLSLPSLADEAARFSRAGETWLEVLTLDAAPVSGVDRSGELVHPGALAGATLRRKPLHDGVEDFVDYPVAPAEPRLRYELRLGERVAGLRLVENVLELLDKRGAPRFSVRRPTMIDAHGTESHPRLVLRGCRADRDPRPPQGRAVSAPGSRVCQLDVDFSDREIAYPAVLDPAWTATGASSITPFYGGALFSLPGGRVLHVSPGTLQAEVWDPQTGTFATTGAPQIQRHIAGMVALEGGSVALVGGANIVTQQLFGLVERYDVESGTFVTVGQLQTPRRYMALSQLQDGNLFLAGGCVKLTASGCVQWTSSTEIFDMTSGQSTSGPQMPWAPRSESIAATLEDGRVLIAGGADTEPRSDAYVYSSVTGMTATGSMQLARRSTRAIQQSDGNILLCGGVAQTSPGAFQAVQDCEVFDPLAQGGKGAFHAAPNPELIVAGAARLGDVVMIVGDLPWGEQPQRRAKLLFPGAAAWVDAAPPDSDQLDGVAAISDTSALAISLSGTPSSWVLQLQPAGSECLGGGQCASGSCNGGVCCAEACSGACTTCSPIDGACLEVQKGDDPDSCVAPNECGPGGRCALRPSFLCNEDAECASDHCVDGYCCTTACTGSCETCAGFAPGVCLPVAGDAAPNRPSCNTTGVCGGSCDGIHSDCGYPGPDQVCEESCEDSLYLRRTCDGLGSCARGAVSECAGGFACSDAACLTSCESDDDCAPNHRCSEGRCLFDLGMSCGEAGQCASGFCSDGVCCDSACDGQCEACDVAKNPGECTPSTGVPHGARPACDGFGPCAGVCDGSEPEVCSYPGAETVCSTECAEAALVKQGICGGAGLCVAQKAAPCPGEFACQGFSCLDACDSDAQCRPGFACQVESKHCIPSGQRCEGDVSVSLDGSRQACEPYRCLAGRCPDQCIASDECSGGFVCSNGTCIEVPRRSESDGCQVKAMGKDRAASALGLLLALCAAAARRRRAS